MTGTGPTRGYAADARQGLPGHGPGVVATCGSTYGALIVMQSQIQDGPPLHVHQHEDESLHILDGTLTVRCGGDTFLAGPGSFVFLPRNLPHTFSAQRPATVLLIAVPGGLDEYFRDLHHAGSQREIAQVQESYGITVL